MAAAQTPDPDLPPAERERSLFHTDDTYSFLSPHRTEGSAPNEPDRVTWASICLFVSRGGEFDLQVHLQLELKFHQTLIAHSFLFPKDKQLPLMEHFFFIFSIIIRIDGAEIMQAFPSPSGSCLLHTALLTYRHIKSYLFPCLLNQILSLWINTFFI